MKQPIAGGSSSTEMERLIQSALAHLEWMGFRPKTIAKKLRLWEALAQFVGEESLSTTLAGRFLSERGVSEDTRGLSLTKSQRAIRTAVRQLIEFKLHRYFQREGSGPNTATLTPELETIRRGYESFCRSQLGHRPQTLRQRARFITRFLSFQQARGITSIAEIRPAMLSAFVAQHAHLKPGSVATACGCLRSLLGYLYMRGLVPEDLRIHVPAVRIPRDARIPPKWKREDVEALLSAVDRASPKGKRDYAILLLAARLGMRAGDIRGLRLEGLRWDEAKIEFIQEKTRQAQCLPLTEEVGGALIEYLRHARPVASHREVFLRLIPPFAPFAGSSALWQIITSYRRRAGIKLPAKGAGGMHGLRHSLASRLLEEGTPLETISHVMGHVSPDSTMIYAKVAVESLRDVALDWEVDDE